MYEIEEEIRRELKRSTEKDEEERKELEKEIRTLRYEINDYKKKYKELLQLIDEFKKPPAYGCIVIKNRREDVLVLDQKRLQTVSYGVLDEKKKKLRPGMYVLVGNVPASSKDIDITVYAGYGPRLRTIPGIIDLLEEEAPLIREKIISIDPGEKFGFVDEDIVVIGNAPYYSHSIKVEKKRVKELGLRPNMKVDCLPETFEIVRAGREEDRYEVIERPKIGFDDIGGLKSVKTELMRIVIAPMINEEDYGKYGKRSRKILFYGPPGCGKTMLARALAGTLTNCGFYRVNAGEIHEMWVGKSEENVRSIFESAKKRLKDGEFDTMILFFDEIDALAPHRGIHPGSSGVEERVVGALNTELEGLEEVHPDLIVMAATNMPMLVDSALRQRFDTIVEVPQPNDRDTVRDIISKYINEKVPLDYRLVEDHGEDAASFLMNELTDFLFKDEKIIIRYGDEINRREIITGRLISQIVEQAKYLALYDRTILRMNCESKLDIDVSSEKERLEREYKDPEQIGINMNYLHEVFDKFKIERAEEIVSSRSMYLIDRRMPMIPDYYG
jgi:ATP-dependent 26S proteasome regulatory subunit